MGKHLDLDDVAAGHPVAQRELDDLRAEYTQTRRERDALNDECARLWDEKARLTQRSNRVLERFAADERAGLYETEYDGQMLTMCLHCDYADDHPYHDADCPIIEARALIAEMSEETQS